MSRVLQCTCLFVLRDSSQPARCLESDRSGSPGHAAQRRCLLRETTLRKRSKQIKTSEHPFSNSRGKSALVCFITVESRRSTCVATSSPPNILCPEILRPNPCGLGTPMPQSAALHSRPPAPLSINCSASWFTCATPRQHVSPCWRKPHTSRCVWTAPPPPFPTVIKADSASRCQQPPSHLACRYPRFPARMLVWRPTSSTNRNLNRNPRFGRCPGRSGTESPHTHTVPSTVRLKSGGSPTLSPEVDPHRTPRLSTTGQGRRILPPRDPTRRLRGVPRR